jgi:predicted transcriptional regulator of viral defense system
VLVHDRQSPDIRGLEAEAYEQNGYFSVRQARSHGVSSQLLNHHVRSGRFAPVRRGLYRIQGFPSVAHDDMRESWMAVGPEKAVLSHESALELLDLSDNIADSTHLLVPRRHRGLRRPAGVALHTRPDGEDVPVVWREGMPLTAPARTIIDTLGRLQPEQAEMAVRQALGRGLVTKRRLRAEAERRRKGRALESILAAIGR